LQAELLVKLAGYDRSFTQRAGDRVHVGLLVKPKEGDSTRAGEQMQAALARIPSIAGLPHEEAIVPYQRADALPAICRNQRIAILFVLPGFHDDIEGIRTALDGVDVLTATGVPDYVKGGIVLGFEVAAGRPQLLVHLAQAKRQNVALRSEVLRLMKVYEWARAGLTRPERGGPHASRALCWSRGPIPHARTTPPICRAS
jgi:hypothetical protein